MFAGLVHMQRISELLWAILEQQVHFVVIVLFELRDPFLLFVLQRLTRHLLVFLLLSGLCPSHASLFYSLFYLGVRGAHRFLLLTGVLALFSERAMAMALTQTQIC